MAQKEKSAMRTVPNQKVIINKVILSGKFLQVDEETFAAGSRLDGKAFLVWMALNYQYFKHDREFALSTTQISKIMGDTPVDTVQSGIKILIANNWLKRIGDSNRYELVNPVHKEDSSAANIEQNDSAATKEEQVEEIADSNEFNPAAITIKDLQNNKFEINNDELNVLFKYLGSKIENIAVSEKTLIKRDGSDCYKYTMSGEKFFNTCLQYVKDSDTVNVCKESRRPCVIRLMFIDMWNSSRLPNIFIPHN